MFSFCFLRKIYGDTFLLDVTSMNAFVFYLLLRLDLWEGEVDKITFMFNKTWFDGDVLYS